MIDPIRQEVLEVLTELSEVVPEVRLGQLMANLSYLARGLSNESIWEMEDNELLEVCKKASRRMAEPPCRAGLMINAPSRQM